MARMARMAGASPDLIAQIPHAIANGSGCCMGIQCQTAGLLADMNVKYKLILLKNIGKKTLFFMSCDT
jgi:hypothetical protein